ncbi:hypothetical protein H0H92_000363 [Tricholoma furcatifolium]|nr:hypothetical protein H0H92_000363 [Tricholoma furcatifolium]
MTTAGAGRQTWAKGIFYTKVAQSFIKRWGWDLQCDVDGPIIDAPADENSSMAINIMDFPDSMSPCSKERCRIVEGGSRAVAA